MSRELLLSRVGDHLNVTGQERELAANTLLQWVVARLKYGQSIRIGGIGVFQLKKEPLPREDRKAIIDDGPINKRTLIYAPVQDEMSKNAESAFVSFDLDELNINSSDYLEKVFSLNIDQPLIPIQDSSSSGFASRVSSDEHQETLEEKIEKIVNEGEILEDFNIFENYLLSEDTIKTTDEIEDDDLVKEELLHSLGEDTEEEIPSPKSPVEDFAGEKFSVPGVPYEEKLEEEIVDEPLEAEEKKLEEEIVDEHRETEDEQPDEEIVDEPLEAEEKKLEEEIVDEHRETEDEQPDEEIVDEPLEAEEKKLEEEIVDERRETEDEQPDEEIVDEPLEAEEKKLEEEIVDEHPETEDEQSDEEIIDEHIDELIEESDFAEKIEEKIETGENEIANEEPEPVSGDEASLEKITGTNISEENAPDEIESNKEDLFAKLENYLKDNGSVEEEQDSGLDIEEEQDYGLDNEEEIVEELKLNEMEVEEKRIRKKSIGKESFYTKPGFIVTVSIIVILGILTFVFWGGDIYENAASLFTDEGVIETQIDQSLIDQNQTDQNLTEYVEQTEDSLNVAIVKEKDTVDRTGLYREIPNDVQTVNQIYFDGSLYTVQVSSWKSRTIAENQVEKLRSKDFDAFIYKIFLKSKQSTWHRVRIGYFNSLEEAENFMKKNKF